MVLAFKQITLNSTGGRNMESNYRMVEEFHKCMDQPMDVMPTKDNRDLFTFRFALIQEEFKEFVEAAKYMYTTIDKANNKESYEQAKQHTLKELMDIKYVINGWCATYGWDADEAFKRVHESNMSKLVDGKPHKNEDGKVMKGPNYKLPDLSDLVHDDMYNRPEDNKPSDGDTDA
jgi:predicted HAD superfamily Cof-like phosphohydrolase